MDAWPFAAPTHSDKDQHLLFALVEPPQIIARNSLTRCARACAPRRRHYTAFKPVPAGPVRAGPVAAGALRLGEAKCGKVVGLAFRHAPHDI